MNGILLIAALLINGLLSIILLTSAQEFFAKFFGVSSLLVIPWSYGAFQITEHGNTDTFERALFIISPIFISYLLFIFAKYVRNRKIGIHDIFLAVTLAVASYFIIVNENLFFLEEKSSLAINKPIYAVYAFFFVAISLLTYFVLLVGSTKLQDKERLQISYTFLGIFASSALAMTTNLALPLLNNYQWLMIGPLSSFIAILGVGLASTKYKLFHLRPFIHNVISVLVLAILSIGVSILLIEIAAHWNNDNNVLIAMYTFIVFTLGGVLIKYSQRVNKQIRKFIYNRNQDANQILHEINVILSEKKTTKTLKSALCRIDEYFKPDSILLKYVQNGKVRNLITIGDAGEYKSVEALTYKHEVNLGTYILVSMGSRSSKVSYDSLDKHEFEKLSRPVCTATFSYIEQQFHEQNLKRKVQSATQRLVDANKELQNIDANKDEFISMASHQLRTPLTTVKNYLLFLKNEKLGKLTSRQSHAVDVSYSSVNQMVATIDEMLDAARIANGTFSLEPTKINLSSLLYSEIEKHRPAANSKNIAIIFKPKLKGSIKCDSLKITEVVSNFLDNAIRYGGQDTEINITLESGDEGFIKCTVRDHGIGIKKSDQKQLFNKFYRGSNAKKIRPDGTGLGLYVAKKIIEAHGGRLIFTSKINKGSTFGFELPKTPC